MARKRTPKQTRIQRKVNRIKRKIRKMVDEVKAMVVISGWALSAGWTITMLLGR
jgi:hypothetical protein